MLKNYMNKHRSTLFLLLTIIIVVISGIEFLKQRTDDKIHPSAELSKTEKLSNYLSNIKGTNGDADVYVFDSKVPGANVLLLGGTHPNEPSGMMTAITLIENMRCEKGKIFIIPQACLSGFTCTDPLEGYPQFFHLKTKSGERKFRFGSRVCNPLDQWPDPMVYNHYPSGQQLSGYETRNLNRSYPGKENGTFSERIGYAIMNLIKKEKIDLAFDLHEAAPEIPIINAIIAHEKCKDIAAGAILNLELEDLKYALEISPKSFRGLSHREWGDGTEVKPFLMETSNPIQGRLRGKTSEELIINGKDDLYKLALNSGRLRITYDSSGCSLSDRIGRHLQGMKAVLESYNEYFPGKEIILTNIPGYKEVTEQGISNYLK